MFITYECHYSKKQSQAIDISAKNIIGSFIALILASQVMSNANVKICLSQEGRRIEKKFCLYFQILSRGFCKIQFVQIFTAKYF